MSRAVRAAALAAGAVVGLLVALAAYAFVAPSGTEPTPAPGPAPTVAAVPA
ncbi:hypothetical protein [Promicromonospora sp. NFX87]|uniref:hypothetical protein n=1 Tax=Promicromonospora sp. NFX87 TaxID=3402691 RepID=UPI003AFB56DA